MQKKITLTVIVIILMLIVGFYINTISGNVSVVTIDDRLNNDTIETLTLFKATYGESGRLIANVGGCILLLIIWLKDIIIGIKYLIKKIKNEIGDF